MGFGSGDFFFGGGDFFFEGFDFFFVYAALFCLDAALVFAVGGFLVRGGAGGLFGGGERVGDGVWGGGVDGGGALGVFFFLFAFFDEFGEVAEVDAWGGADAEFEDFVDEGVEEVAVVADELWTYVGKKRQRWLWWAIDRASKKICGWTLGDRGTETAKRLDAQLPHGPELNFCTDFWHPYSIIFTNNKQLQGKAHTYTIESWNNRIRIYLARLRRKTHCYSKSEKKLSDGILLFFLKNATSIPFK